jgi:hypothetical protein
LNARGWFALLLLLAAQALLLFPRLDLLPVWGDEQFTLTTSALPPGGILETLRQEEHPPLYYLLVHGWLKLPWPAPPIVSVRALSVLFALMATVLFDRLWLVGLERSARLWLLVIWTVSPFLTLYARMGRSYTMQLCLALIAVRLASALLERPGSVPLLAGYTFTAACLLYTHYLSGLSVLAAAALVFAWKTLRRDRRFLLPAMAPVLLVALVYSPWVGALVGSAGRMRRYSPFAPLRNIAADHALDLGYWFVSFHFGETAPWILLLLAAPVSAGLLWLYVRGWWHAPAWAVIIAATFPIAYYGATRWVSYYLVPARLLFLFPFFLMLLWEGKRRSGRIGTWVFAAWLGISVAGLGGYYQRENFFNKGYLIPYEEMTARIRQESRGQRSLGVVDLGGADILPLKAGWPADVPFLLLTGRKTAEQIWRRVEVERPERVWVLRRTRDRTPGKANEWLEQQLVRRFEVNRFLYVPYSAFDGWMMARLKWSVRPTHVFQMLELRAPPAPPLASDLGRPVQPDPAQQEAAHQRTAKPLPGKESGKLLAGEKPAQRVRDVGVGARPRVQ